MKKILQFWPYLILSLILGGYFLLTWQFPPNYSVILIASFLIFYFFTTSSLMGHTWALISTFLLTFSATILSVSASSLTNLLASLSVIVAIEFFLFYIHKPSSFNLILSGFFIGLTMALRSEAWVVLPLALSLIIILAIAKLGREWPDIDPAMRRHKVRILIAQNLKIVLSLAFLVLASIYIIFTVPYLNDTKNISESLITNWLLNNLALHPLGSYVVMLESQDLGLEKNNWIRVFADQESIPLILLLGFGLLLYLVRFIKAFWEGLFHEFTLVNYLGIYEREFFYAIFITVFGLINILSFNTVLITVSILPYLIFLAILSLKSWFITENTVLSRNIVVKLSIFKNQLFSLSLKTGVLAIVLAWHLLYSLYL